MKKVLALVLAVMMLATTAFAATVVVDKSASYNGFKDWLPGNTIKINDSGIVNLFTSADATFVLASDVAGQTITNGRTSDGRVVVKNINSDNYSITKIKFNEGKKLVQNQGIVINNAEERVDIKLNQNYGKTTSSNLDVEFTLKGKKVGKSWKPENLEIHVIGTVGYYLREKTLNINQSGDVTFGAGTVVYGDSGVEDKIGSEVNAAVSAAPQKILAANWKTTTAKKANGDAYENGKDFLTGAALSPSTAFAFTDAIIWKVGKVGDDNYGDLDYTTADGDVDVTVRVYKDDKLYLYTDVDPVTDVLKAFADEDAEISFLNSPNTTFNSTATVRIYKEEGDTYFYEWVDGKLVDMNGKGYDAGSAGIGKKVNWDDDEGCYVLKTRTMPGTMVFSDKPLPIDETPIENTTTPENPDTGANDVVGIATALAAVALVSAAAVTLKK